MDEALRTLLENLTTPLKGKDPGAPLDDDLNAAAAAVGMVR